MFYLNRYYTLAYSVFACIAIASGIHQFEQSMWLPLLSNGVFAVTAFYAYDKKRYDLALFGVIQMGTSLVWHSSSKYGPLDFMFSRLFAVYAYFTTVISPLIVVPITVLFTVVNEFWEYETGKEEGSKSAFDDVEMTVLLPLACVLTLYRVYAWYKKLPGAITYTFVGAIVTGVLGFVSFFAFDSKVGHSAWHVFAALSIALSIEPNNPYFQWTQSTEGSIRKVTNSKEVRSLNLRL